jgi:hypothetical protein
MGIPTGKDFVDFIRSKLQSPELVLLVLSPEFFKSQFCNNEVGATWGMSIPIYPILVPPIGHADLRGVLAGKQAVSVCDKEGLNNLRDDLTERLNLTPLRTSHWERKRDKFLGKLAGLISSQRITTEVTPAGVPPSTSGIVTSSGSWLKLHDRFYETQKVHRPGRQKISLEIVSRSAEDDAALDAIRPQ